LCRRHGATRKLTATKTAAPVECPKGAHLRWSRRGGGPGRRLSCRRRAPGCVVVFGDGDVLGSVLATDCPEPHAEETSENQNLRCENHAIAWPSRDSAPLSNRQAVGAEPILVAFSVGQALSNVFALGVALRVEVRGQRFPLVGIEPVFVDGESRR